jgi:hypothetical protein
MANESNETLGIHYSLLCCDQVLVHACILHEPLKQQSSHVWHRGKASHVMARERAVNVQLLVGIK